MSERLMAWPHPIPDSLGPLHPTEERLIRYIRALGYGTIEQLKIEAGKPVLIERVTEKVRLS